MLTVMLVIDHRSLQGTSCYYFAFNTSNSTETDTFKIAFTLFITFLA